MCIVTRYKEIIESGCYGRVAYRNIRGVVTDEDIRFIDPDGEIIAVINPLFDNLYVIYNDAFFDTVNESIHDMAADPSEHFS